MRKALASGAHALLLTTAGGKIAFDQRGATSMGGTTR